MEKAINTELISKCVSGDRKAQRVLYEISLPYLHVICQRYLWNRQDIHDVLQETFIRIFSNLRQFDVSRSSFKTWSTRIAINCSLRHNQKQKKTQPLELLLTFQEIQIFPEALKKLSNEDLLRLVKKMPEPYYQVFNMYVIDGFSHKEIGEILHITESLSRKRLARSRSWLKKKLPQEYRPFLKSSFK